jgi:hypothetical protein
MQKKVQNQSTLLHSSWTTVGNRNNTYMLRNAADIPHAVNEQLNKLLFFALAKPWTMLPTNLKIFLPVQPTKNRPLAKKFGHSQNLLLENTHIVVYFDDS